GAGERTRPERGGGLGRRSATAGGLRPGRGRARAERGRAGGLAVGVPRRGGATDRPARPARPGGCLDPGAAVVTTHEIPLEPRTLHGWFSRDYEPVLSVETGDSRELQALN